MNSPYTGKFQMTQTQHSAHDGFDLVGLDSKKIHATVSGTVKFAGWENAANHSQGFGQYVCIRGTDNLFYYYGHLSAVKVQSGDTVSAGELIGFEGNTGHSTGSHCHYCVRKQYARGNAVDLSALSGIPNALGTYGGETRTDNAVAELQNLLNDKGANLAVDGIAGPLTLAECRKYTIDTGDCGPLTKWVQSRLNKLGFDCGLVDGFAGERTMRAVHDFQSANKIGVGYLAGSDWDKLIKG